MPRLPICSFVSSSGKQCEYKGRSFEGYCGHHHSYLLRHDPAYQTRYEASLVPVIVAPVVVLADPVIVLADPVIVLADPVIVVADPEPAVDDAAIRTLLPRLMTYWDRSPKEGFECVLAYLRLRYSPIGPATRPLFLAARALVSQDPAVYTGAALQPVRDALLAFPVVATHQILSLFPIDDGYRSRVRAQLATHQRRARQIDAERIWAQERVRRRLAAEAAALQAGLQQPVHFAPHVIARDPKGGVDLRALAADPQSVHRSSVQEATKTTVDDLMKRPVPTGQDTLVEVSADMPAVSDRAVLVETFATDYLISQAFGISYGALADRVWAFIRSHTERGELTRRLSEEVREGIGMCSNGKMARLTNVLQGFDEDMVAGTPPMELFQGRIAKIAELPVAEREAAARLLFVEFRLPVEAQGAWLEALED